MSALSIDDQHWLQPDTEVKHQRTPNVGGAFKAGQPDTIVIHFTGGRNAESSANWLCNPDAKASAHLVIGKKGEVIQLADFQTVTWHAGTSTWEGRSGLNRYSIGIEIDNVGALEVSEDGHRSWFGSNIPAVQVIHATHRNEHKPKYWQTYTEPQIERVEAICELLMSTYVIKTIVGHEEISPGRKVDPGPAFPLDKIRNRLLGDRTDDPITDDLISEVSAKSTRALVTADRLNIRQSPSLSGERVSDPLKRGTLVTIEEKKDDWSKVKVETEGWVKSEFLTTK